MPQMQKLIIFFVILSSLLLTLTNNKANFVLAEPPPGVMCKPYARHFNLTHQNATSGTPQHLSSSIYPRRFNFSIIIPFASNTTIRSPLSSIQANITFNQTSTITTYNIHPLVFDISLSTSSRHSWKSSDSDQEPSKLTVVNLTLIARHAEADEQTIIEKAFVNGFTLRISEICRPSNSAIGFDDDDDELVPTRITDAKFDLVGPALLPASTVQSDIRYSEAKSWCVGKGATLPTLLKKNDYENYFRYGLKEGLGWAPNTNFFYLGSETRNILPSDCLYCWLHDFDFDSSLCTNDPTSQYFALFRSNKKRQYECKSEAFSCDALIDNNHPKWDDEEEYQNYNYSLRLDMTSPETPLRDNTPVSSHGDVRCMYYVVNKTISMLVTTDYSTRTKSVSKSQTSSGTRSSGSFSSSSTENATASHELTRYSMSLSSSFQDSASHTIRHVQSPTNTQGETSSQHEVSITASFVPTESKRPTLSEPVTESAEFTQSSKASPSKSLVPTASLLLTQSEEHTETDHQDSRSISITPKFITPSQSLSDGTPTRTYKRTETPLPPPPPPPPLANAIPADEAAAVAATATLAATMAAPAAAQTLRSMSILATVGTEERCKLSSIGKDSFASESPKFPESFLPFLKIPGGNGNQTQEDNFALPGRRGSIVANSLLAPLCIATGAVIVGALRNRIQPAFKDVSVLASGRVNGITTSLVGALFADGVFASATVLISQQNVAAGDVVLAVFGVLMIISLLVVNGVMLYRSLKEFKDRGNPLECIASFIRKKRSNASAAAKKKNKDDFLDMLAAGVDVSLLQQQETQQETSEEYRLKKPMGFYWFLFGNESWGPSNNEYKGGGPNPLECIERYRSIFATCRGLNYETEKTFTTYKRIRRHLATSSFFIDVTMTIIAAIGRGRAVADPCSANGKVQLLQLFVATVAFLFSLNVQAPISPMRRLAVLGADFVMFLGTITLLVLGTEAGPMVARCALAAAFMATASSLALFVMRRLYLPLRGIEIVGAAKRGKELQQQQELAEKQNVELQDYYGNEYRNSSGNNSYEDDQHDHQGNNNSNSQEEDTSAGVLTRVGNTLLAPILSLAGDGEVVFDDDPTGIVHNHEEVEEDDEDNIIDLSGFIDDENDVHENDNDDGSTTTGRKMNHASSINFDDEEHPQEGTQDVWASLDDDDDDKDVN